MSDLAIEPFDWTDIKDSAVKEIVRLAELQLSDLLAASLSADQRAVTQAGILTGFGAALLAAAAAVADSAHATAWSALVAGAGMIVAALISGVAAKPIDYRASGHDPKNLLGAARDEARMLQFLAEELQVRIEKNRAVLERTATCTSVAYNCALASIACSIGVFLAFSARS